MELLVAEQRELGRVPRAKAWKVWELRREGAAKDWEMLLGQEKIRKSNDKKVFKIRLNNQSTGQFPKGGEVGGKGWGKERGKERKKGEGRERRKDPKGDVCICVYPTNELYPKYESSYYLSPIKRHNKNVIIRLLPNYSVSRDLDQYFTKRIQKTNNFHL